MARPTNAERTPVRERLIAAREGRGLDRAAAAAATRIPLRYLAMLEEGEYPLVADPAYLSPYLRRYAAFLGLPAEQTVIAFLGENEAAERVAAASIVVRRPAFEEEPTQRVRPALRVAMVMAVLGGAGAAFVDAPTAQRWIDGVRPSLDGVALSLDRVAGSVGRFVASATSAARDWFATDSPPIEVAASAPLAAAPEITVSQPITAPPAAATPVVVPTPPPMATAPAATTPMQLSARDAHRLELVAITRQVFVWVTIDGGERREVELRQGESAQFEARRELLLTLDDAGGVRATWDGKPLPPLGRAGHARRNIRFPERIGS